MIARSGTESSESTPISRVVRVSTTSSATMAEQTLSMSLSALMAWRACIIIDRAIGIDIGEAGDAAPGSPLGGGLWEVLVIVQIAISDRCSCHVAMRSVQRAA